VKSVAPDTVAHWCDKINRARSVISQLTLLNWLLLRLPYYVGISWRPRDLLVSNYLFPFNDDIW